MVGRSPHPAGVRIAGLTLYRTITHIRMHTTMTDTRAVIYLSIENDISYNV